MASKILAIAVAGVMAAGCATPYIDKMPVPTASGSPFADALALCEDYHAQYRTKVIEIGNGDRLLSNVVLGGGLVGLGLSAARAHSSAIAGTALGTGALYGFGLFNADPRRAQVYIEGMKALECAKEAVIPLNDTAIKEVTDARRRAEGPQSDLERVATSLRAKSGAASDPGAVAALAAADLALKSHSDTAAKAMALQRASERAGLDLRSATFAIDRAVVDAIRASEPKLKDVPAVVAQLPDLAGLFQPAPSGTAGDKTKDFTGNEVNSRYLWLDRQSLEEQKSKAAPPDLQAEIASVTANTARLNSATRDLAAAVNSIAESYNATAMKQCKVADVPAAAAFTLSPTTIAFDEGKVDERLIKVSGATPPIIAKFIGDSVSGFEAPIVDRATGIVRVKSKADLTATPSSHQMSITDGTRVPQFITVTVSPKPATK